MALALDFEQGDRAIIEFEGTMVVLKVFRVHGARAKLSFVAEKDVKIRREVVFDKIHGSGATDVVEQHIERLQEKDNRSGVMKAMKLGAGK